MEPRAEEGGADKSGAGAAAGHPLPGLGSRLLGRPRAPGSHGTHPAGPASDWQSVASFATDVTGPVISLQLAETEREPVKAGHLRGAGASHISLRNNGHRHTGGFDLRTPEPCVGQAVGRGRSREKAGRTLCPRKPAQE